MDILLKSKSELVDLKCILYVQQPNAKTSYLQTTLSIAKYSTGCTHFQYSVFCDFG